MSSYVYFIGAVNRNDCLEAIKIGKANDPFKRLSQLHKSTGVYQGYVLMCFTEYEDEETALRNEKDLHECFSEERIDKEWFRPSLSLLSFICRELAEQDFPIASDIGIRT